ncbi:MAG: DUF4886 domain-containing protein [Clostridia bacterium]|nr:DUF4886 domain-containing protein [Clostridia bacterium]
MKLRKLICLFLSLCLIAMSCCFSATALINTVTEKSSSSIKTALESDDWDYVTFQQASPNSGQYNTYFPFLTDLVDYVADLEPNAVPVLHQTWAYEQDSTHGGFANYGNNQTAMYNAIVDANARAAETAGIDIILPSGVAWQEVRATAVGDTLTEDGYHGNVKGCYIASAVWYEMFTGHSILDNNFIPAGIDATELALIKTAVHNTVAQYRDANAPVIDEVKVLSIGNSFSRNAHKFIPLIAQADDVEFTVANLYIGGCTLSTHWGNAKNDSTAYEYTKFIPQKTNGTYFSSMKFTSNCGADYYSQTDISPQCSLVCMLPTVDNYDGAYVEFDVKGMPAGDYNISIASRSFTSRGKYQMSINGEDVLNPVDFYRGGGSGTFVVDDTIGTLTIKDSNDFKLRFTCVGKNAASSGYSLYLAYIIFTPVSDDYVIDDSRVYGTEGNTVADIKAALGEDAKIYNGETEVTEGIVGTGMKVQVGNSKYDFVYFGDLSGDGAIDASDILTLKTMLLMPNTSMTAAQLKAANVNHDANDDVTASDMLLLKRFVLNLDQISQR